MAKYSKKQQGVSEKTQEEAMQVARATQKPGQTKEQTKLIALGIQKGIDQYKKQQKAKSREQNKLLKKAANAKNETVVTPTADSRSGALQWLPWGLLLVSWGVFVTYVVMTGL